MNRSLKVRYGFYFSSSSCWCTNSLAHRAEPYLSEFRRESRKNMYKQMRLMCLDYSHDGVESFRWHSLPKLLRELHHFLSKRKEKQENKT